MYTRVCIRAERPSSPVDKNKLVHFRQDGKYYEDHTEVGHMVFQQLVMSEVLKLELVSNESIVNKMSPMY